MRARLRKRAVVVRIERVIIKDFERICLDRAAGKYTFTDDMFQAYKRYSRRQYGYTSRLGCRTFAKQLRRGKRRLVRAGNVVRRARIGVKLV